MIEAWTSCATALILAAWVSGDQAESIVPRAIRTCTGHDYVKTVVSMRREGCKRLVCLSNKAVYTNATVKNHECVPWLWPKNHYTPEDHANRTYRDGATSDLEPYKSVVHYLSTLDPHANRYNEHCRGGWKRKKQRANRRERVRRRDEDLVHQP